MYIYEKKKREGLVRIRKKSIAKSDSQLLSTAMQYMKKRKTRREGKPGKQIDSIHPIYKKPCQKSRCL